MALAPAAARSAPDSLTHPIPSLRDLAAKRGILFGTAAGSYQLADEDFAGLLARQAAILVPEYELKREIVEPQPGRFDFSGADRLADFAGRHNMAMRGHTCVWYAANPPWLDGKIRSAPDDEVMVFFIAQMMGRYCGRMHSWDVVNEAILPSDGRSDGLRDSAWLKRFGPGYIDIAYHAAKQADPNALLVYNDWGCEGGQPWNDTFRAATLRLLEGAKARGVPIEALGLQGHLNAFGPGIDQAKLRAFLDAIRAMGLQILVTELDIDDTGGSSDARLRDQAGADAVERFLDVVVDCPATKAVLTWGLTDRYLHKPEWIKEAQYRPRKLPFDDQLAAKPMASALARVFGRR